MPRRTIFIAFVVSLGGFLYGYDATVINGVFGFIIPEFDLSDSQVGWVGASPGFAAMFAMLTSGKISDHFGRKRVLIVVAFLYAISALFSAYAFSYESLIVARMLGGIAFGAALVLAPMYIAEVSTARDRGKLVTIQQLNIVIGFLVAYLATYYLNKVFVSGNNDWFTRANVWRWMFASELIPAMLYFVFLFVVPKSPRWLYMKKRKEDAYEVLTKLHGKSQADLEERTITHSLSQNEKKANKLTAIFHPSVRYVLVVGLVIGVLQMITGINAIYYYANSIFEQSGVGTDAAFTQSVLLGAINVAFTLLAMALIDRVGRRPLLLIGIGCIAISMCITALGFGQATYQLKSEKISNIQGLDATKISHLIDVEYDNNVDFTRDFRTALGNKTYKTLESALIKESSQMNALLILIGILGFIASFSFSLGPVMWVMLSELFSNKIRGLAVGFIGFVNSLVSTIVVYVFPVAITTIGNAYSYLAFAVFAVIGWIVLFKILPETKGKSLEQIEAELVK